VDVAWDLGGGEVATPSCRRRQVRGSGIKSVEVRERFNQSPANLS
jgi:hypothetical protein